MSAKPYTAEELAELRMGASEGLAGPTVSRALATIDAVTAERNAARLRLAQAEEARDVERAGAMHAQLESSELREAARALLANLDDGNSVYWCGERAMGNGYCSRAQTKTHHGRSYCDEHAPVGAVDTPGAPALRRLRALVEVKP